MEPASFRDPGNRVYYVGGEVRRGLRGAAVDDWRALAATGFFPRLVGEGKIVATEPVDDPAASDAEPWDLTLRHQRVPFISHPYEWTFSMLRDAAALHLEILDDALAEGMTTKDGSAYNLQWQGAAPTFIDIGSLERLREGEPWAGYRQFCQTLLYPLMLTAHLGVDFQPWLRAQLDGIEPGQLHRLMTGRQRWRAGVWKHVYLHHAMQGRMARTSAQQVREELREAGFSTKLVVAVVRGLRKLVNRLEWRPAASHWQDYRASCSYSDDDRDAKHRFVEAALRGSGDRRLVLDLGANDGTYSRLAARYADYVVAVESDHAVTDALYRQLRDDGERRILPLVMDLANPSPGIGWRGRERASFVDRCGAAGGGWPAADPTGAAAAPLPGGGHAGGAGTVLALALVHHLAIGRNVPLPEVCDFLAGLGRRLVVEFVEPADPMARRLLADKPAGMFGDYHRAGFERLLEQRFVIEDRLELPSGTRTLYRGTRRD